MVKSYPLPIRIYLYGRTGTYSIWYGLWLCVRQRSSSKQTKAPTRYERHLPCATGGDD